LPILRVMATDSPSAGKRGFLRPILITVSCLLAVVLLTGIAVWIFRLPLAERAIVYLLHEQGITPAGLTVKSLSTRGITLTDIALGPEAVQKVDSVEAVFSIDGLRQGEVASVRVQDARIQGHHNGETLTLPGLDALFEGEKSGGPPPVRIASLTVDSAQIAVTTPYGDVLTHLQASATTEADGLIDLAGKFTINAVETGTTANASGRITGSLFPTGEVTARIEIDDGAIQTLQAAAERLTGTIQLIGTIADLATDISLRAGHAHIQDNVLTNGHLTAGLNIGPDSTSIDVRLDSGEGHASLTGDVTQDAGGYSYDSSLSAGLSLPNIAASLNGTLHAAAPAGGKIAGRMDIADAALTLADIGLETTGVSGVARFTQADTGLPDAAGEIKFQRLRYSGIDAEKASLTFEQNAGTTAVTAALSATKGDTISVTARQAPDQPLTFGVDGTITPGPILDAMALGIHTAGRIELDLSGTLADPWDTPETLPDRLTVSGYVTPNLQRLQVPGVLRDGALQGPVQVMIKPGEWQLSSPSITLSKARLASGLLQSLPAALRKHTETPITIELRAADTPHAQLRITPRAGGYAVTLSGTTQVASRSMVLAITGQVGATSLPASISGASGQFHLKGTHTEQIADSLAPITIRPDLNGTFTLTDNILTARTGAASQLKVDSVVAPGQFQTTSPLLLTIERPFRFRADLGRQPVELSYDGDLTLQKSGFAITAGQEPTDLLLSDIPARIIGGNDSISVAVGPAKAELSDHASQAAGITVKLTASDAITIDVDIGDIRQKAATPVVIPLQLQASATLQNNQAQFSAHLHDQSETISIRATGEHDAVQDTGYADVESARITFLPTVLQPVQLFPVIGKQIQDADGHVETRASVRWGGGEFESNGEILAEITALKSDEILLENAAAVIAFDSLLPLSTPPGQEIHIGKLDIGIPLTAGRIEFQINREGHITAALRELDLFDGNIDTEVFDIPARLDGFTIPLQVNGVRLDSLLAATKVGELTATGILNGQIPVKFENGGIFLRNGVLESAPGGGTIQYQPEAVGPALSEANEGTALFLDIVRDFQYDSVRVTIDETDSGDIPFEFKIKGKNPTVYKGIPVELNLSMSGPLRSILQQGLKTYTLPDRLLERMQEFADQ